MDVSETEDITPKMPYRARCECGYDDGGTLEVRCRWDDEFPPGPYSPMPYLRSASQFDGDPDGSIACPACGEDLDADMVIPVGYKGIAQTPIDAAINEDFRPMLNGEPVYNMGPEPF